MTRLNSLLRLLYHSYPFSRGKDFLRRFAFARIGGVALRDDGYGNQLLLDLNNYIDATLYLDGAFEPDILGALLEWSEYHECRVFIDVGANLGAFSICMAALPTIKAVYAFEPDPRNYAQLMGNIFLSKHGFKIRALNAALSEETGEATLFLSRGASGLDQGKFNTGTSSLEFSPERHDSRSTIKVQMAKLDDVVDVQGSVVAIKIDVEGHECAVLRGSRNVLTGNKCAVIVEAFGSHVAEVESFMTELGYAWDQSCQLPGCRMYRR